MRILVYASDANAKLLHAALESSLPESCELDIVAGSGFARSYRKKAPGALVYLDASCMEPGKLVDCGLKLDELEDCAWAVLDREGLIEDPASLFHAGASDYLGPRLLKSAAKAKSLGKIRKAKDGEKDKKKRQAGTTETLGPGRLLTALAYSGLIDIDVDEKELKTEDFTGWDSIPEGRDIEVRFCYAALGKQKELLERIGEKRLQKLHEDFSAYLSNWSQEAGGLVWIRESMGNLLLFPITDRSHNPILAAFRLLLDRAIIAYEVFRLEIPLTFRFAFHQGRTMWRRPGSTGTVVSEDVNFVFHLGARATIDGAIVVAEEAKAGIHPGIRDLFTGQGEFEGHILQYSRRFED